MSASAGGAYLFDEAEAVAIADTSFLETDESAGPIEKMLEMIDLVCSDEDWREQDEPPPASETQEATKNMIEEAALLLAGAMPYGDPATYWGELSITWRNGTRLVRLACFSDGRPPRLDHGISLVGALGEYQTDLPATFTELATRIEWLRSAVS